ncbi:FAD-dependent oxidoreductase [Candidatus Stoquefichus massiliensis]|uniref:oxidoreductase n=1 Tax=Candidatus Stoquefichus massiliensis TaxID=1470350 RepID=UPI0004B3344C|nr:FAD-dependent oxidoreductase [Candidatus Stoquefichus massiliensis]
MLKDHYQKIFQPIMIHNMEVKNRIFMSPMSTNFATKDGYVTDEMIYHYARRAKGGVGLIITEVVMVEPIYKYIAHTASLQDDSYIEGWKRLADEVHKYGGKICPQLLHPAYMALPFPGTPQLVGPSEVGPYYAKQPPRALRVDEIHELVEQFGDTALRAKKAGMDGVEIHAAHAHALIGGFLSPLYNKRIDEYGGDITHRIRLLLEVIANVREKCGRDFPIIVRISGDDYEDGGQSLHEGCYIAKRLEEAGADMIHVSGGTTIHRGSSITPPGTSQASHVIGAKEIKKCVHIPVATVGRLNEPWILEEILERDLADICMVGRSLLCDPDFVNKIMLNKLDDIRPCIGCLGCLSSTMLKDHVECGINPALTMENEETIVPASVIKKILVIGGGPAGLEASYILRKRGHNVTLAEKSSQLGGAMIVAGYPIAKQHFAQVTKYFIKKTIDSGVDVELNTCVDKEYLENHHFDEVIVASGAKPIELEMFKKHPHSGVAQDILHGKMWAGKNVVIVGGGSVGCEVADFIAPLVNDRHPNNKKITVIEMKSNIIMDDTSPSRSVLVQRMERKGVQIITDAKVTGVDKSTVTYQKDGQTYVIKEVDTILEAIGYQSDHFFEDILEKMNISYHVLGDANHSGKIKNAITDAYQICKNI